MALCAIDPVPFWVPGFLAWLVGVCFILVFLRAFVCWCPCPVLGFLLVPRSVLGYTLLCSFAGCRCSAPDSGAAALAGLLRFASIYGRFGVFASPGSGVLSALLTLSVSLGPAGLLATALRC